MQEDVRERHGVLVGESMVVTVAEQERGVKILVNDGGGTRSALLTTDEARYLASKLRRLAWRVECRP